MIEFFRNGGVTMWLVLLIGLASGGVAMAGALLAFGKRRAAIVTLGALGLAGGICTGVAGAGAYLWALSRVMDAVATVEPALKARLFAAGVSEAMNNLVLGGALAIPPVLLGTAVLVRGLLLPREHGDDRDGAHGSTPPL